ncbi:hypothetical protein JAAARDRAFT_41291 [Jaapia argillacea MUCL 33604]|uniref:Secreted protein n=1 Tax=Jaapia argillacea MUCL 33604 TaxID=933084 RepID=A0A067P8W2_9AGAM|nr:hypothetical protein JAAARDRAFT_41291 [Jaapia argillacea MUCL 33604]
MKFMKSALVIAALTLSALSQSISISEPAAGTRVCAGCTINVEVDKDNSQAPSKEVGIVIAMRTCNNGGCVDPLTTSNLGKVLYNGPYNPHYGEGPTHNNGLHQDFPVEVPTSFITGKAELSVFHLSLVGDSQILTFEIKSVMVDVA